MPSLRDSEDSRFFRTSIRRTGAGEVEGWFPPCFIVESRCYAANSAAKLKRQPSRCRRERGVICVTSHFYDSCYPVRPLPMGMDNPPTIAGMMTSLLENFDE
jgi:hypothetical protein